MPSARLTPKARSDLAAAIRWISRDNPSAARGLGKAVVAAAKRLGDHPDLGRERLDLTTSQYRTFALTGYPYVVIYDAALRPPIIIRILHGARDLPETLSDL